MHHATIQDLISQSPLPRLESEVILAFLLQKTREYIITHLQIRVSKDIAQQATVLITNRTKGIPLAYLIGEQYFYGYKLLVNQHVLIPRPETEVMIDCVLSDLSQELKIGIRTNHRNIKLLDIGTGSGAIIISLAKELKKINPSCYRTSTFYALDISNPALKVARKNINNHKLSKKIKIFNSNLLKKLPSSFWGQGNIVITANLPYLTKKQISHEQSIQFEPALALDGGYQGLEIYQKLFSQVAKKHFNNLILYCEIDPNQATSITRLAKKEFQLLLTDIRIIKDLRKKNRFLSIKLRKRS